LQNETERRVAEGRADRSSRPNHSHRRVPGVASNQVRRVAVERHRSEIQLGGQSIVWLPRPRTSDRCCPYFGGSRAGTRPRALGEFCPPARGHQDRTSRRGGAGRAERVAAPYSGVTNCSPHHRFHHDLRLGSRPLGSAYYSCRSKLPVRVV
jgi:hypothetical protein